MFVTLCVDIPDLGKKNERVSVSDAYARNVLVPQKKAFVGIQTAFKMNQKKIEHFDIEKLRAISHTPLQFIQRSNDQHRLYKKITEGDIVTAFSKKSGLPKDKIHLDQTFKPLDTTGKHHVTLFVQKQALPITVLIHNDIPKEN